MSLEHLVVLKRKQTHKNGGDEKPQPPENSGNRKKSGTVRAKIK